MYIELMDPHGRAVEVGDEKSKSYAREGKHRAQTKEVKNDAPHYSNEQDEVCDETFSSFDSMLTAFGNAGCFAGTRSIPGTDSKN